MKKKAPSDPDKFSPIEEVVANLPKTMDEYEKMEMEEYLSGQALVDEYRKIMPKSIDEFDQQLEQESKSLKEVAEKEIEHWDVLIVFRRPKSAP